jgi:hypothetical protein
MSMADSDVTVEILKDIRDEIRGSNQRLDAVEKTIDQRLGAVETTLLDLAEQQRFVVRYTKVLSERDSRLELRVGDLETRVDKLESK